MHKPFAAVLAVAALFTVSCAHVKPRTGLQPTTSEASVPLHGHALKLHLSDPANHLSGSPQDAGHGLPVVLLVYATGDAGWWGKDRDIFTRLKTWGYPVVGFSAREYVHHLGTDALRPSEVARDYDAIIRTAELALGLPAATRAVLVGKSRGAGLAIAAAGTLQLKPELAGVLAVGLTREEEYVHRRLCGSRSRQLVMLQTYLYLPQLGSTPVAVLQSTGDNYVPAAQARLLFGSDTAVRELVAIAARDHNFGGAVDVLYDEMARSLNWIVQR